MKYEIKGNGLPVVICKLDAGETIVTESGSMSWMDSHIQMDTKGGGVGKVFGRMFAGESLFQNEYTAVGKPGEIAFASSFPGSILALDIEPGREVIIQKKAFLAGEPGVKQEVYFQKKIATGFLGGEGFVMQKLSGKGIAFIEVDGEAIEYDLAAGQSMVINSGYLAMMDSTCSMEVQTVKGLKNVVLGGEGLFNTVVKGPGRVVIQSMPIHKLAQVILPFIPMSSDK